MTDLRKSVRFATWNVLTLKEVGCQASFALELKRCKTAVAGIAKARLVKNDQHSAEDTCLRYSGGKRHINGVGLTHPLIHYSQWGTLFLIDHYKLD